MLRKISLALVAAAALGTAALAPTSASAHWYNGWGWGGLYETSWYSWSPAYSYYPGYTTADSVAYCARRYRSYDPASGSFLGNDGFRHRCG